MAFWLSSLLVAALAIQLGNSEDPEVKMNVVSWYMILYKNLFKWLHEAEDNEV